MLSLMCGPLLCVTCTQTEAAAAFDTWRQAEVARLQRDRRVLEKQSKAILKVSCVLFEGLQNCIQSFFFT